jgi:hypothetical protein
MRQAAVLPDDAPDLRLQTVVDVVSLLGQTINQTRKGALDPKVCNAVVQGASVLLRALEASELAKQLTELRAELERIKGATNGGEGDQFGPGSGAAEDRGSPAEGDGEALAPEAAGARP